MLLRWFSSRSSVSSHDRLIIQQFASQLDHLEFPKGPCSINLIPLDSLEFKYSKSSGPGGQHVNKGKHHHGFIDLVQTRVDMRFDLSKAHFIPIQVKNRLQVRRITLMRKEPLHQTQ
jgi:hypothetical protein